jgi:hypothetical protein
VAAGELLAGRYRLEEELSANDGAMVWKATDGSLARSVTVCMFAAGFPRAGSAIAAARAAARLSDPRLVQIFDADNAGDQRYIVTEWPSGDRLDQIVAAGPLDSRAAAEILEEVAGAVAVAHAAGLSHLCLTPDQVWRNRWGEVKLSGLSTAAAMSGATEDDPGAADTRGLARLFYAALTGLWPGQEQTSLPAAARSGDRAVSPAQARAGISADVDALTCRAMFGEGNSYGPAILSPAGLAVALGAIAHPTPDTEPLGSLAGSTRPFEAVAPPPPATRPLPAVGPSSARPAPARTRRPADSPDPSTRPDLPAVPATPPAAPEPGPSGADPAAAWPAGPGATEPGSAGRAGAGQVSPGQAAAAAAASQLAGSDPAATDPRATLLPPAGPTAPGEPDSGTTQQAPGEPAAGQAPQDGQPEADQAETDQPGPGQQVTGQPGTRQPGTRQPGTGQPAGDPLDLMPDWMWPVDQGPAGPPAGPLYDSMPLFPRGRGSREQPGPAPGEPAPGQYDRAQFFAFDHGPEPEPGPAPVPGDPAADFDDQLPALDDQPSALDEQPADFDEQPAAAQDTPPTEPVPVYPPARDPAPTLVAEPGPPAPPPGPSAAALALARARSRLGTGSARARAAVGSGSMRTGAALGSGSKRAGAALGSGSRRTSTALGGQASRTRAALGTGSKRASVALGAGSARTMTALDAGTKRARAALKGPALRSRLPELPPGAARPARIILLLLALVASVLIGWAFGQSGSPAKDSSLRAAAPPAAAPGTHHSGPAANHGGPPQSLHPARAAVFDPYGDAQGGQTARLAIDATPGTAWHTAWYTSARFGNLKPGTGLLIDMGQPVTITAARLSLGSATDASLQLRVGPSPSLSQLRPVAQAAGATGQVQLHPASPAHGRYALIWFTRLPRDSSGSYEARVYNVRLQGTS